MKVRLLVDVLVENPDYHPPDPAVDKAAYKRYLRTVPHAIKKAKGEIIDHPEADQLCQTGYGNAPPRAEPADDEARLAHAEYLMQRDQRVDRLRELARDADPEDEYGAHLIEMAKRYGVWEGPEDEEEQEAEEQRAEGSET